MIRDHCSKIGYIAKPHGIDGNVIVRFDGEYADEIETGDHLFVDTDGTLIPFFIEEIRPLGDSAYIKFVFVDNERDARKLRGLHIYIADADFPEPEPDDIPSGSFFTDFTLVDENSGFSGTIEAFEDNPMNPLFRVNDGHHDVYIPAQKDFIIAIDRKKKVIRMKLPEGLTDLQA